MINKEKAISFNSFFIFEFIRHVLEKMQGRFDENAIRIFNNLAQSLNAAEDPVLVLEKLARYQETNDLSIFLFDILDRIEKIPAQNTIENLDDVSEDFINLYALMVEDPEVLTALDVISTELKPSEAEKTEEPEEERLTLNEFYERELKNLLAAEMPAKELDELNRFYSIVQQAFEKSQTYDPSFTELATQLNGLFAPNLEAISGKNVLADLKDNVQKVVKNYRQFKEEDANRFVQILASGQLPLAQQPAAEEKGETTIDDLLKDYFRTEVDDHIDVIQNILKKPFSKNALSNIIKNFKSLKEVSMIHGYSGVESLCERIVRTLRKYEGKLTSFTPSFQKALNEVLKELHTFEKFDYEVKDQKLIDRINRLLNVLEEALTAEGEAEEAEAESVAPSEEKETKKSVVTETAEPVAEEELLTLEDRPKIFGIFREILEKLSLDLQPFTENSKPERFLRALDAVLKSSGWLDARLEQEFFTPFMQTYRQVFSENEIDRQLALNALAQGWQMFLKELSPDTTLEKTIDFWQTFKLETFISPEQLSGDDWEVFSAFAETMRAAWQKLKPSLEKGLVQRNKEALFLIESYLKLVQSNLTLLRLDAYKPLPAFLSDEFIKQGKKLSSPELIDEIDRTMELFFERISTKGMEGNISDLVDVLHEVLSETAVTSEAAEDELDFVKDSQTHADNARQLLQKLKVNPEDRDLLNTIASEVHAIYSAAQFMHHGRVADAAIIIEETAEMFASPDVALPKELPDQLDRALQSLKELMANSEADITKPFEALQAILDRLVLEEPLEGETKSREKAESEPTPVEEKPLFSAEAAQDEELREIFKEDARNLLTTLKQTNAALLKNPVDEENIRAFDQAVHTLKNAAKMTGLDDLTMVFGRLEEISEQLNENSALSTKSLQEQIAQILNEFDPLISKGELSSRELDDILARMDGLTAAVVSVQKSEKERDKRLRKLFVEEARELIEKINHNLIELEKVPESSTVLAELLRHLHTIKGGAMMANFNKIGELAHKLEEYFQLYRDQNAEKKIELLPTAFTIIDLISEMVRSVEQGKSEIVSQYTARLADIDNKLFYLKDFELPKEITQPENAPAEPTREPLAVQEADNTIKIKSSYLDHLVNLATEMVVNRTELTSYFEKLKKLSADLENRKKDIRHFSHQFEDFMEESAFNDLNNLPPSLEQDYEMLYKFKDNLKNITADVTHISGSFSKLVRSLEKNVTQLSVLSKSLHGDLLKARMLPVRLLFERFERPVHDLARKQRKQIELIMEDNGAELDRALVDALYEPLLHMIRNAVDHGIEKPAQRKKAGKDPKGKIILRARQEKNQVVIDIIDDGQGIDLQKIREKIVELKLASEKQARHMSESRLLEYIFRPEFSTTDKTTTVSGRGIGLDIVAFEIQKLKGIVRVKTTPERGTTFSIRVPLTLIVSQSMLIKFHEQTIAIPLIAVMESLQINEEDILLDDQRSYVQVRGKLLPYVDIDDVLRIPGEESVKKQKNTALVLHDSGVSIVLGIEEITGRQDIVIKSLGNLLQNVELISGGTILTNGEVGLILDYASLIHKVETEFFSGLREQQLVRKIISTHREQKPQEMEGFIDQGEIVPVIIRGRKPALLVVDDAASVREFISAFLERHGFNILKAADGKQALAMARKNTVDLLITDLEMPEMHGFDLIQNIRKMKQYQNLPIIILTAQAGKNFQAKGAEVGANAFISKPFKEGDLLRMINAFIKVE